MLRGNLDSLPRSGSGRDSLPNLASSSQLSTTSRQDKRPSLFTAFPDIKPTGKHDKIIDAFGAAANMQRVSSECSFSRLADGVAVPPACVSAWMLEASGAAVLPHGQP